MTTTHRNGQDASISYITTQSSRLALCPLPSFPGIKETVDGQAHTQAQCQGRCGLCLDIHVFMNGLYWGDSLGLRKDRSISHQYSFESSPGD